LVRGYFIRGGEASALTRPGGGVLAGQSKPDDGLVEHWVKAQGAGAKTFRSKIFILLHHSRRVARSGRFSFFIFLLFFSSSFCDLIRRFIFAGQIKPELWRNKD